MGARIPQVREYGAQGNPWKVGIGFSFFGLAIMLAATVATRQHERHLQNWPHANATVLKTTFVQQNDSDGGSSCRTDYQVRFAIRDTTQDDIIQGPQNSSECDAGNRMDEPAEGEQWEIGYDPGNSGIALFSDDAPFHHEMRNIRLAGIAVGGVGLLLVWHAWRHTDWAA